MSLKEISLSESNAIKGLAIILIMLHHFEQSCLSVDILNVFKALGPVGCSAFFFVSGYGLTISKSPKIFEYWMHRIVKIWIPFMLANIIYIGFNYSEIDNIGDIMLYIIGIKLINGHCWFIHALLFLYIGYALASNFKHNIILYPVIFGFIYSVLTRSVGTISWIAFPIGIFYAQKLRDITYSASHIVLIVLQYLCIPTFIVSCYIYYSNSFILNRIPFAVNFIAMVLSSAFTFIMIGRITVSSQVMIYIGKHSIDYYLIHGICLLFLLPFHSFNHYVILLCFVASVAISSTVFGYISSFVQTHFKL